MNFFFTMQSPGRDSPGSSGSGSGSRHSTASVDSGRASGCHLAAPHSRSSLSSSSVSSVDHNIPAKVERLLLQGVPVSITHKSIRILESKMSCHVFFYFDDNARLII